MVGQIARLHHIRISSASCTLSVAPRADARLRKAANKISLLIHMILKQYMCMLTCELRIDDYEFVTEK